MKLDKEEELVLESRVRYDPPPEGTNLAQELVAAFRRHSRRPLLVEAASGRQWTGDQLLQRAGSIATSLIRKVGLKPGQVAFMFCDHSGEEILFALGALLAGGALYGATPEDGIHELKTLCQIQRPHVLISSSRYHQMAAELRRSVEGLEQVPIIWLDDPTKTDKGSINDQLGSIHITDENGNDNYSNGNNNNDCQDYYLNLIQRDGVYLAPDFYLSNESSFDEQLIELILSEKLKAEEHNASLMLTSGSTGKPKVVASTHEELVHGLYSMISATRYPVGSNDKRDKTADNNSEETGRLILPLSKDSILAGDLPLDHGAGLNTMFLSFMLGAKFVVMDSYNELAFWQTVDKYRINCSVSSTTFAYRLMRRLKEWISGASEWPHNKPLDISCLKFITCVGSKMAFGQLVAEINVHYPEVRVSQGYGATEIGFMSMLAAEDCRSHLHSVGHLFPGLRAKVVDLRGGSSRLLGPNESGELLVWSRSAFKEYKCLGGVSAGAQFADCHDPSDNFYRTGDLVHYDEDGRLYVEGRLKDTLFLGSDWKILPAELEDLIDQHPLVEQSAVVGVPDEQLPGCHKPKAFVKLISSTTTTTKSTDIKLEPKLAEALRSRDLDYVSRDIYLFAAQRTAEVKHLKGGVRILDEFPRVGLLNKVDRKALKAMD